MCDPTSRRCIPNQPASSKQSRRGLAWVPRDSLWFDWSIVEALPEFMSRAECHIGVILSHSWHEGDSMVAAGSLPYAECHGVPRAIIHNIHGVPRATKHIACRQQRAPPTGPALSPTQGLLSWGHVRNASGGHVRTLGGACRTGSLDLGVGHAGHILYTFEEVRVCFSWVLSWHLRPAWMYLADVSGRSTA